MWLTQIEAAGGVDDIDDYKELATLTATLRAVGLASADLAEVSRADKASGKSHVHVLLKLPEMRVGPPIELFIGENEGYEETISSYMEIAHRLKESEEVRSLSNYLASVEAKVKDDGENSSATGKTQMAFNLKAREECDVFYIVCGTPGDREQSVYSAFGTRTGEFNMCINLDLKAMERRTLINSVPLGSVGQICAMPTLALYSFILAALQGNDRFFGTTERSDIIAELKRRKESRAKPLVFFLDEFPRTRHYGTRFENALCITRNVFRSFGLAVVLSSTNGTARNLVVPSTQARNNGSCRWYSKPQPDTFAQIALKYIHENPYIDGCDLSSYLNAMVKTLAWRVSSMKRRTSEGQVCLLLGKSYRVMEEKVNIIDRHFARLVEQSAFELQLDGNNELCKDNKPWECRCVLPPPEEDVLLHLAMTGGLFEKSLSAILSNVQPIIHYEITDQRSNNERFLEELSTAAFVLASHAGGVGGVPFPRFLGEFLFDLGVSEQNEMVRLLQDVEKAGWTQTVPFLSPPNGK